MESVTWLDDVEFSNFTLKNSRIKFENKIKLPKKDWIVVKFNKEFDHANDINTKLANWLNKNCEGLTLIQDFYAFGNQGFYIYFEKKQEAMLFKLSLEAII